MGKEADTDGPRIVKATLLMKRGAEAVVAVQARSDKMHQRKAQAQVVQDFLMKSRDHRRGMPAEVVDRAAVVEHVAVSARTEDLVEPAVAVKVVATTPKSRLPEMALPTQEVEAAAVHSAAAPITRAEMVVAASSLCAGHPTPLHQQCQHGRHPQHQRIVAHCHSDFRLMSQSLTSRVMM